MLKVASYNIRKGIGTDRLRRPERILDVLREVDADIVALQEADRRFGKRLSALPLDLIAEQSDYMPVPFDTRAGSIGHHGNAVLIRRPLRVLDHDVLHLPTIEPRGAVLCDIAIGDHALRIVGMHLDLSGLRRRQQVRAVLADMAKRSPHLPSVLMGDLNEWSRSGGCLGEFVGQHHDAHTGPSFHSQRPMARLDRIFVSHDLRILTSGTHHSLKARRASDHLPVWAELSFE
ncbi:MAG: endonuclease/exonuclease/phosphatase family protein [Chakrabartia sp.]